MKARYHLVECPLNFKNLSRETEGVAPILFYSFEIILHPSFANISKREIYIYINFHVENLISFISTLLDISRSIYEHSQYQASRTSPSANY